MSNSLGFAEDVAETAVAQPEPIRDSLRDTLKDAIVNYSGPLPRDESELKSFFFRLIDDGFANVREIEDVDELVASELISETLFRLKDLLSTRLHIHALLICLGKISDSEETVARDLGVTKAAVSKAKIVVQEWFGLPCRVGRKDESRAKFARIALTRARATTRPTWTGQKFFNRL
jgi:hypothetical protein